MRSVIRRPGVICDAGETIAGYVNAIPCMFIASSDSEQLANDISESDLTYIKCQCGLNEAFCVVNNGYINDHFVRLGVEWCRKYKTETILITFPIREKVNQRRLMKIVGKVYGSMGQVNEELEFSVPFTDTDACFDRVFGKHIALGDKAELVETDLEPYATVNGRRMADIRFKRKYPSLS